MKKFILYFVLAIISQSAFAQHITFMPSFTEQTQWAGYYVAQEKGFYELEGVNVSFVHPNQNSTASAIDDLKNGDVQIIAYDLCEALIAIEEKDIKLVNVLQTSQNSSLLCVSRKAISSINNLDGKKIARWKTGWGALFDIIANKYKIRTQWIPFIRSGVNLFVYEAVDALLCYKYDDYYTLLTSIGTINDNCIITAKELGFNVPEDGLYVEESYYRKHKDLVDKFVTASIKGWEYVRAHPDEALDISVERTMAKKIPVSYYTQKQMLKEILKLQINPLTNRSDYAPVSRFMFEQLTNNMIDCGLLKNNLNYSEVIVDNSHLLETKNSKQVINKLVNNIER